MGESIDVILTCADDGETKVPITVFIDEIQVITDDTHKKDIKVDDKLTLRMKYPSLNEFIDQNFGDGIDLNTSFDVIAACIEMVFLKKRLGKQKIIPRKNGWRSLNN